MTTPAAAALYEAQHNLAMESKGYAVFNPHGKPLDDLPVIYGFNNGGSDHWYQAVAIAEDGVVLGGHICSSEGYMRHDLGVLEGTRPDRHEIYQKHYPDGYRMDFVPSLDIADHEGLNAALAANKAAQAEEN
ncbi:MAG TPA: hypothetical protein PKZ27_03010 [Rhodocyclaceae bacterium]|nr:hypothetical protein [Burkholderiaceae bacterium]HRP74536.1 hypothetical protein [Rhodocyclaceae bacterium]